MSWDIYARTVLALVFVLGLIGAAAFFVKRFGLMAGPLTARRRRRLALVEALPLDGRRRLVLVRRDDTEHLLLVGGSADLVVERGIAGFAHHLATEKAGEDSSP